MAKQIIERLIDDLDGGEATQTVQFSYDGIDYTIDLSEKNAAKLRTALSTYITHGSRASAATRAATPYITTATERRRIREWAKGSGKWPLLGSMGRIPEEIIAAYRATGRRR